MLNNIEKNNPFKVPENYFQDFNNEIMSNLPEKKKLKKTVPLWRSVGKWVASAAVITGFAVLGTNYLDNYSSNINSFSTDKNINSADNSASIENDYYLFLEDEAARIEMRDAIYNVGL